MNIWERLQHFILRWRELVRLLIQDKLPPEAISVDLRINRTTEGSLYQLKDAKITIVLRDVVADDKETLKNVRRLVEMEHVICYFESTVIALFPNFKAVPSYQLSGSAVEAHARMGNNIWARRCELRPDEFVEQWVGSDPTKVVSRDSENIIFVVRNPNAEAQDPPAEAEEAGKQEFETLKARGNVSKDSLLESAKWLEMTTAKWMLSVEPPNPANAKAAYVAFWQELARITAEGRFSEDILHISTRAGGDGDFFKINIHIRDFTDEGLLKRTGLEVMKKIPGFIGKMSCKPDIYTTMELRKDNEFGIRPTVGHAQRYPDSNVRIVSYLGDQVRGREVFKRW